MIAERIRKDQEYKQWLEDEKKKRIIKRCEDKVRDAPDEGQGMQTSPSCTGTDGHFSPAGPSLFVAGSWWCGLVRALSETPTWRTG